MFLLFKILLNHFIRYDCNDIVHYYLKIAHFYNRVQKYERVRFKFQYSKNSCFSYNTNTVEAAKIKQFARQPRDTRLARDHYK